MARDHVLALVAHALESAKLEALLAKGAGLRQLYPSPWSRPMEDIDLLVRPRDLSRVAVTLEAAGFLREPSDRPLTEAALEIGLRAPTRVCSLVELHTSMDKVVHRPIDLDAVFARATPNEWAALRVPTLEDQLLFVVQHLAADEFRHAPGIVDLEVLIGAGADLELASERASEWQATTALYVALSTLRGLLATPAVSPQILARLEPGYAHRAFLRRHFDVGNWPVSRRPTQLGLRWLYRQAALHDSLARFIGGVSIYAVNRARER